MHDDQMYSLRRKPRTTRAQVMTDERLSRIETKLDQLAEAMITMARMEEKMVTLFKRMDKYDEGQSKMDARVQLIERATIKSGTFGYLVDKAFWIVLGVGLTFLAKKLGG